MGKEIHLTCLSDIKDIRVYSENVFLWRVNIFLFWKLEEKTNDS